MRKCRHCGREIVSGQNYRVVGYEMEHGGLPENVQVHTECLAAYEQERRTTTGASTFEASLYQAASSC